MKLYRFRYSPYARKVQMLLDLLGASYDLVEVPYGDRSELAELTGGYVAVPVLQHDSGEVIVESRSICERLLQGEMGKVLVPAPLEGPIWAYADFADGPLEDVLFRLASPNIREAWSTPAERGLYVFIKERKFGKGCVDAWAQGRALLLEQAWHLLAPTLSTLERCPFLFGAQPTLADAALYGNCMMLEEAAPELLAQVAPSLVQYARRLEAACPRRHL
ncbi:MAG: glutathione S-transferase family protein [Polyangiaceae bacterium]